MAVPPGVEVVQLPPLGLGADYSLVTRSADWTLEQAQQERGRLLLECLRGRPRTCC